jgi:predicted 3-demethylubiquinone-9 3-methyltransferase (glyoxalase superfamily)
MRRPPAVGSRPILPGTDESPPAGWSLLLTTPTERTPRCPPRSPACGSTARPSRPPSSTPASSRTLDGQPYQGLNGGHRPEHPFTEAISFSIACTDQPEVDHYWDRLSEGGRQGPCGWLEDRFGVSWQVVPQRLGELLGDPDPERAQRAMQAMMGMRKIVVAELEAAADGVPVSAP